MHKDLLKLRRAPAIAFHPGGEYLVAGADDLEIYHVKERESVTMYNPGLSISVAISPDGAVLANGNDGGEVLLWDVHFGSTDGVPDEVDTPIRTLKGHPDVVTSVAFSPDNTRLASSGNDGSMCLWDVASGKLILTSAENGGIHSWVAFSPDGKWLATTGADGSVALWDISTATKAYEGRGHTGDVNVICFAPDGATLASGGTDGKVVLWRVP